MDNGNKKNSLELQTRRRSSTRSSQNLRTSITSISPNISPIPTIASRSSAQSVVIVQPPSFLTPSGGRKMMKKTGSQKSDQSEKSTKSDQSLKSSKSDKAKRASATTSTAKRRMTLTSSFLRRKRIEYAGIFCVILFLGQYIKNF